MKLSNKGRYGVRAIFDIAFHNEGRPTQIRAIAERQAIPARFLEQIFQDLKRAGLVVSKRGPKGGYALAKEPHAISIGDIVQALEGAVTLRSPTTGRGSSEGDATSHSVTEDAFRELGERMQTCLDEVTIANLCEQGKAREVQEKPKRYVYSI